MSGYVSKIMAEQIGREDTPRQGTNSVMRILTISARYPSPPAYRQRLESAPLTLECQTRLSAIRIQQKKEIRDRFDHKVASGYLPLV
jgi:hypothetical protein